MPVFALYRMEVYAKKGSKTVWLSRCTSHCIMGNVPLQVPLHVRTRALCAAMCILAGCMQHGTSQSVSKMVCVPALLGLLQFVPFHLVPPTPVPYAKRPLTRSLRLEHTSWGTSLPSFQTSALVCRSCPTMDKMDASAWS